LRVAAKQLQKSHCERTEPVYFEFVREPVINERRSGPRETGERANLWRRARYATIPVGDEFVAHAL
jgi:hypothetical protein